MTESLRDAYLAARAVRPANRAILTPALVAAAGLAIGVIQGCAGQPPVGSPQPPTLEEAQGVTYRGLTDLDGAVTVAPRLIITGDLDGDDVPEAVVHVAASSSGTGTWNHLAVLARRDGGVQNIATTALGDRVALRGVRISEGILHADVVRAGAGDPRCCPGELMDLSWRLVGTVLEPATVRPAGRLTLEVLAGPTWVLTGWTMNDAAPPEPAITLRLEAGRVSGSSGCNTYTASATPGDLPGDVSIDPPASTRMACPGQAGVVEARWLAQLSRVRSFGFMLGEMVLTYDTDGGADVMRFRRDDQAR